MLRKINQTLNIALFPFKDLNFFKEDLICKICEIDNIEEREKYIDGLYRKIRNNILYQCPIRNIDEIELMINKYYLLPLENTKEKIDVYKRYLQVLKDFTTCLFTHRDGKISYKYWKNELDDEFFGPYNVMKKVQIFYNLNKIISMDLLSNVYLVNNNIEDEEQLDKFYAHINLADMQLDDILVKGVSENHIHANAAFDFNLNWQLLMNEKIGDIKPLIQFDGYLNDDFILAYESYVDLAVILRLLLSLYLKEQNDNKDLIFEKWLKECDIDLLSFIERIQQDRELSKYKNKYESTYLKDIIDKIKKNYSIVDGERKQDIILSIFPEHDYINTFGENIFLFKCLKFLYKHNEITKGSFTLVMELFLQYIRIKNEVYKCMIQSDNIKGLTCFQNYYNSATSVIKNSIKDKKEYYELMLRTLFQNEYLMKIELRLGISENQNEFRNNVKSMLQAYKQVLEKDYMVDKNPNIEFPRVGLVYSLLKRKDEQENNKCWYMYDENKESTFGEIAYKNIQEQYRKKIRSVVNLRNSIPYLSNFIIGIDAASLENNTPVQIFAPIYEEARDSKEDKIILKDKDGKLVRNKSLAFTFHAGEDFRHLISGLRRIDEVIQYCKFHSGDRIGHATALGVDVDYWSKINPVVILPRGEYLDNLLWIWGIYTKTQNNNPKVSIYLEQEIYTLVKLIFGNTNGINTPMIYDAYKSRFERFVLNKSYMSMDGENKNNQEPIFCIKSPDYCKIIWNAEKLNHAYQCKCYFKKINEPIYVSVKQLDIDIMKEVQKNLGDKVSKEGIVIEINPSSNANIGEMENIFKSHAYEINHIVDKDFLNVMININTDDPIVFNTNISNEYAYIYYGMIDRGVNKESALNWIDKIRKCGMETSFINNKISNAQYYEYLTKVLEEM